LLTQVESSREKKEQESEQDIVISTHLKVDSFWRITLNFFKLAIPTMISCSFLELTFFINGVYASRMDDRAMLAGVGLGTVVLNMGCLNPLVGMNGAVETLVS
jgi:Na+-driven multidrug efflux pump